MRTRPLRRADRAPLVEVLRATEAFTDEEVQIALELIDAGLASPPSKDYLFLVAEGDEDRVLGYACWGPVALADGVFDLYWIAVDPRAQGGGIGRALMAEVERRVAAVEGRMILVETAGKPSYAA